MLFQRITNYKLLAHLHKDDDAMLLILLAREFGLDDFAKYLYGYLPKEYFFIFKYE